MRIQFLLLLLVFAQQLTAQTPTPQLLPADQLARPGEAMTWTLSGPPLAPFSVLIDTLPGSMLTPHGVFGLAGSPALSIPIDGLGLAFILSVPGSPSGVYLNAAGDYTIQSPPFNMTNVGLDLYLQAVVHDGTHPSILVLSDSGTAPSARARVIAPEDVTLNGLDIVDVNPVDPYLTAITGVTQDVVPSVTFHDDDSPSAVVHLTNNEAGSITCRLLWTVSSGGAVAFSHVGGSISVASGTSSFLRGVPSFADLSPLNPGLYDVTATLEVASATGGFSPTAQFSTTSIRITSTRPTILIHGIIEDGSRFLDLAHLLETDPLNPRPVRRFSYGSGDGPIAGISGKAIEFHNFLVQIGASQFDIVAHSIGGLVTRRYLLDHPPVGFTPHLILFGTPHMGTSLAFISAGVSILDLAYPGALSGSTFMKDITPASAFLITLNDDWHLTAPNVRVLNIIGTNCAGTGDGIIAVNEAFLADVAGQSSTVINRYVSEVHGTAPAFLNLFALLTPCSLPSPGLGAIDAATAATRSSYLMLNDFLASSTPLAIATPSGASSSRPSSANRGTLWIPLVNASAPATTLNNAVIGGLIFFNWETYTFIWVDAPTGGGTLCLNILPLGCLFASTCSLPSGVSQAGRTRRCHSITPSGGCSISANTVPFPH